MTRSRIWPAVLDKKKTVRINGCVAAAQAAKYADVDVITAYLDPAVHRDR